MNLRTATLCAARMLSPVVRELTFDPGPGFTFVPGQWVSLRMAAPGHEAPVARSYSIASWPRDDGRFDLAVTLVEGGPGSAFLHAMSVGDSTPMVDAAAGFFTLPEVIERPLLLVATGTGIAPIRAMLGAAVAKGVSVPATLVFGVRTPDDILYRDEWSALAATRRDFRFVPTLSRATSAWEGHTGYVQTHLAEAARDLGECDAYVCGLSPMVREVRRVLKEELGFPRARIHTERFD